MTMYTAYSRDFNGGTNGADATSAFSNVTGTAPHYVTSGVLEGSSAVEFATSATTSNARLDDTTGRAGGWWLIPVRLDVVDGTNNVALVNWNGTAAKIGDLQVVPARTLRLRDNNTAKFNGTYVLSLGTHYWLAIKAFASNATGHRYKLYSTAGVLLEDSGNQTATATTTETTVNNIHLGVISAATMTFRIDKMVASDTELVPFTVDFGSDQSVQAGASVTLTATPTGGVGPYTYSVTQTGGTSVTLSGTGASRSFTAPTSSSASTLTFSVTGTDSNGYAYTDTVTVNVAASAPPVTVDLGADLVDLEPFETYQVIATGSGGSGSLTYAWTIPAGIVYSASGNLLSFTAPATMDGVTSTVSVTASDGVRSGTDSVNLTTLPHNSWERLSGDWKAIDRRFRLSGSWS